MRIVVGYRDVFRFLCVEEFNVFYVFIGVELLVLFKDFIDFVDINEKFYFFMFVIGVK